MESPLRANAAGRKKLVPVLSACAASVAITLFNLSAAGARELAPEVVSRVWLTGNNQVAAVTLNGDEIARFKSDKESDQAAEEAEDLASRLQEIISDRKFEANALIPSKEDNRAVIKQDGNTVCTFNPFISQEKNGNLKMQAAQAYDASIKVVNAVRVAFGVPVLPVLAVNEMAERLGGKLEMLGQTFCGAASWYGGRFHGRTCSDGSTYNQHKLTAAHRSLPFGTKILVKNRQTGDTCVVEVNDRGPFVDGRVIDVSRAAARELNMLSAGISYVECTVVQ
jgi:rare lipoprotein A